MDLSVSFKKNFGKNASCVLSFNDILNSAYVTAAVDRSNQHTFIYGQYNRRSVKLAYTYKFGKPVKPVKNKKPSAEDEKLRIK
jgi:hypothetical protein